MSWFARSLANSLNLNEDDDDKEIEIDRGDAKSTPNSQFNRDQSQPSDRSRPSPSSSEIPSRGVKEDLSEITKTLTKQFWGVASFLAPPPPSSPRIPQSPAAAAEESPDPDGSDTAGIAGIRSDFAEIGGKFRTGISKLSSNMAVSEITKIASNLLQLGSEEGGGSVEAYAALGVVGATEEVVSFVRNIAVHPGTWLDFPLPDNEDSDDLDMTDVQQEHALAVERLAPRLADLRIELCPGYMSEKCFWKIYFMLIHPKLSKQDADLLSTPEILKARAVLQQELQSKINTKPEREWSVANSHSNETVDSPNDKSLSLPLRSNFESLQSKTSGDETASSMLTTSDVVMEKHPIQSTETRIVDKSVVEEGPRNPTSYQSSPPGPSSIAVDEKYEDDGDDWLKDDNSEAVGNSGVTIPIENEEDVSFSDLEDDDDGDAPASNWKTTYGSDSSSKESRDWVQLPKSSSESITNTNPINDKVAGSKQAGSSNSEARKSNDWLDVEDIDVE